MGTLGMRGPMGSIVSKCGKFGLLLSSGQCIIILGCVEMVVAY